MGSGPSTPKITAQDRAILDLKLQRDKIKQYQRRIQGILDREHEIAKTCLAQGHKDKALLALRRRKYQETVLSKTDGQLQTLEELVSTIEFSLVEQAVLHGLKQGNAVLAEIHKEMNIESVEKLLGETQDAIAYQREIDEMLSNVITNDDEEAVQQELLELQREAIAQEEPDVRVSLPTAPTEEPVHQPQEEVPAEREPERRPERVALEA
ncbi:hypothetical protein SISSUDRAFT_1060587 [Sistotremastrum suecicum HHB10207 ss-3]|uniref:Snf7-domain-containing protein n=1 Tax=Sistotremastrum suecicum HHB10207 ss-3 TaxID=1314776 RepID=A0A166EY72_9AGAM|nr:hypothetical protein SISSUDRAFT_1060587 [Sistotremastrum suecicum HHB10207 ss-3]